MPTLRLSTLGELRLRDGNAELLRARRKGLALLAYLVRCAPRRVPRGELAALLWGENSETRARHSLSQALLELRRALGEALDVTPKSVSALEGAVILDVAEFEADLAAGRLREAVERWRGEFLPGGEEVGAEGFRIWVEMERAVLRQRLSRAFEQLVAEAEADGALEAAAGWAERWADALLYDEAVQSKSVEALRLAGRLEDARARHAAFTARLRTELGVQPSPEWERLGTELERSGTEARVRPGPGSAALFTPDLVGRGAELAELAAAWRGVAERADGSVVVVEGEEGIGKTRLCNEFLRGIARDDAFILRARCGSGEEAGVPWADARELLAALPRAPGLSGAPSAALATVSRLVPAIRERFPTLPEPAGDDRTLEAEISHVLGDVAAEIPLVLLLDDAARADAATRDWVLSLARELPPSVLLLLAARTNELERMSLRSELGEVSTVRHIKLQPLDRTETEALLASMLELPIDERQALAARLRDATDGNPFFLTETVAALVDEQWIVLGADGTWRTAPECASQSLPLPRGVREAIGERIGRLGDPARRVLGAAAAWDRPVSASELEGRVELASDEFRGTLDELIARRLLRPVRPPGRGIEFTHELIRRVARDLIPPPPARRWSHRRRRLAFAVVPAVALIAAAWLLQSTPTESVPVLAVGAIEDRTASGTAEFARTLSDLLVGGLAGVPELRLVSTERMHEVRAQLGEGDGSIPMPAAVARAAGAEELLTGELYPRADGGFRLELRRVDLQTGLVRGVQSVDGPEIQGLVRHAVARIADALGVAGPRAVGGPTFAAHSPAARRLYQEGLDAYFESDPSAASRFFTAALEEDSTFAMAALYLWHSRKALGFRTRGDVALSRAARLAESAPERDRLLIGAHWASVLQDPARFALAESLAVRHPLEPDGHLLMGTAAISAGDFLPAIPHLLRVIAMDSLGLRGGALPCRACDAYEAAIYAYALADSAEAEDRLVREWIRRQPTSTRAWSKLADVLFADGRYEAALAAKRKAASLGPGREVSRTFLARLSLGAGEWSAADRLLEEIVEDGSPEMRSDALWWLTISLREQGRLREALVAARRFRRGVEASQQAQGFESRGPPYSAVLEAQVLFELGHHRTAAALFDSIAAAAVAPESDGWTARGQSWALTHKATALAAAGDTATLARLTDSILRIGARSGFGRDWRLHHYARGLVLARRGDPAEAEREFRRALYSLRGGFSRINLEWSGTLMMLDRPDDAVAVLKPALHGPLEASGLYLTRTELHAALGRAWEAAGRSDSAAAHYRWALAAWSAADPEFHVRRDSVQARLSGLEDG